MTAGERNQIENLIRAFDGHGCSNGFDLLAQGALRRLLEILDEAERTIESVTRERDELLERVPGA
jgi:hypothetical protein